MNPLFTFLCYFALFPFLFLTPFVGKILEGKVNRRHWKIAMVVGSIATVGWWILLGHIVLILI